jgi:hypothetical protein
MSLGFPIFRTPHMNIGGQNLLRYFVYSNKHNIFARINTKGIDSTSAATDRRRDLSDNKKKRDLSIASQ